MTTRKPLVLADGIPQELAAGDALGVTSLIGGSATFDAGLTSTAVGANILFRGTSGGAASTTGLRLLDTDDSNTLRVVCGGDLTGNRTLRIDPADANRVLTFSADATIGGTSSGTNTGDQTITLTGDATGSGTGSFTVTVGKINGTSLAALATGILKNTTTTGVPSIAVAGDFPTLNQNTTGSAATLTTPRAIYGNNFDGSAALTQIIASTYGGTGNGFAKLSGPAASEKTFTLPNASDTIACLGQPQTFSAAQAFSSGAITLSNGTSNIINFGTNGVGAPTFGSRSAGMKLVLYPVGGATDTDYGFAVEGGFLDGCVPNTSSGFKWYGGTTLYGQLDNSGLAVAGKVTATTYLKSTAKTVASLTAAATAGAGARDCVTDALAPTFGAAVVGGGAVVVPVYSDGAAWKVG